MMTNTASSTRPPEVVSTILLICFLVARASSATPSLQSGAEIAVHSGFATSFERLWLRYEDAERQGDLQSMTRILDEVRRLRLERNAFHLHNVALAFTSKGIERLNRDELDPARQYFEIARELDPALPQAYYALARVASRAGDFALGNTWSAYLARFRSPATAIYAWANFLIFMALAVLLVLTLFAALMLYRYGALVQHDVSERMDERLGENGIRVTTALVFLLPLLLTFGVGWLVAYWLVLTFAYQTRQERGVSITALSLLLLSGPLVELHAGWSRTLRNPWYRASISSLDGTFQPSDVFVLEEALLSHPQDREIELLVAAQYKNLGEYDLAATVYRRILARTPGELTALVNLGNIYFAQRDWEGALVQYNTAIERDPDSAMAYYNKSLAHAENFQFREREQARARADELDRSQVSAHQARVGDANVVADVKLGASSILAKFFGLEQDCHAQPVSLFALGAMIGGRGARFVVGSVILGALLLLLELGLADRTMTRRCWKCGSAFCGRCQIGTGRKGLCTQCYHLFIVKDGVSAVARNEKVTQVRDSGRVRVWVFRLLSIVAPGAGHVAEGMALFGLGLLLLWVCGWVSVLRRPLYVLPDPLMGLPGEAAFYSAGATLVVAMILANTLARPVPRG